MYYLTYYIPDSDNERVKQALFESGAGKIGNYDQCCWEVLGNGQFRALKGSQPSLGEINQLEQIAEYKVEMVCADENIDTVLERLLKEHPYEQPAYFISQVMTLADLKLTKK
ncbi:NGG1p interacting factor NIF3 [sulfur-oxidizing endosymbiont of Gigantopelta aegis]|uniref:NGG1p interacting factor NIF3 n=1 Tax=sulfur-oxidizing endosymbiont of Gigantopelta aegis TaxID=2794934 RepID=UPI0018DCE632|nr:NGG1p interacting factor NIF3 [sulfur-oxidizing endosymbiont of Gigantopelta aegis]